MARIYLGMRRGPCAATKLVVVKQLREEFTSDQQFLAMFMDEARITLRLNHPNVVHTYDVGVDGQEYYLTMEFLEGQSLLTVLKRVGREAFPLDEHIWIVTQVLAGLHYAHELREFDGTPLNIVHRDVTPSNVFLCHSGVVKLLDFGIAKAVGAIAATRQGMVKGKLGYVAPEQCLGKPADVRSDIYAAGVMLWEALARRRRAAAGTRTGKLRARIQDMEPRIEQVWPAVPKELAEIAGRALCVDPARRYACAQTFQRDLEHYLAQKGSRAGADSVAALLKRHFDAERLAQRRDISLRIGHSGSVPLLPQVRVLTSVVGRPSDSFARSLRRLHVARMRAALSPARVALGLRSLSSAVHRRWHTRAVLVGSVALGSALALLLPPCAVPELPSSAEYAKRGLDNGSSGAPPGRSVRAAATPKEPLEPRPDSAGAAAPEPCLAAVQRLRDDDKPASDEVADLALRPARSTRSKHAASQRFTSARSVSESSPGLQRLALDKEPRPRIRGKHGIDRKNPYSP